MLKEEPQERVVDLEETAEKRRLAVVLLLQQLDHLEMNQCSARGEQASGEELLALVMADEVQRQIDARTLSGDVVLQVRVERLVAGLELGGHRDEEKVDLRRRQAEAFREVRQAQAASGPGGKLPPIVA